MTCSGGEAMLQPDFVTAIFKEAHYLGLTSCLDTTGQGTKHHHWDKVLPYTDMVLFCIKHLDPIKYEQITGMKQKGALKFADELKANSIPFWVRYVLMPGLSDSDKDLDALIEFVQKYPTAMGVELLPYHLLGKNKWDALGLKYPLEGMKTPSHEAVRAAVHQLEAAGVNVICELH